MADWVRDIDGDFLNLDMSHLICLDIQDNEDEPENKYVAVTVKIKESNYTLAEFDTEYLSELGVE